MRKKRHHIGSALIYLNGAKEKIKKELIDLEKMRNKIHDSQRNKLEYRIDNKKNILKELDNCESSIRFLK